MQFWTLYMQHMQIMCIFHRKTKTELRIFIPQSVFLPKPNGLNHKSLSSGYLTNHIDQLMVSRLQEPVEAEQ